MAGNPGGHGTGNPYHDPKTGQFGFGARRSKKQTSTRQRKDDKQASRGLSRRSGGTSFTDWSANPKDAYANLTVDDGVDDLTAGEIGSINTYSVSVGFRMNYDLRQAAKDPTYDLEAWASDRKNLDSAMKRSSLTENTVLYRGYDVSGDLAKIVDGMKPGDGFTDPGFMSASLGKFDMSDMLMDNVAHMRIYAPKGSKAIVTGAHNMFGGGFMDEVILDRDSTLVFTGKGEDGTPEFRLSQSGIHDAKPFTDYEPLPQKAQPAAPEPIAPPTEQEVSDEINRIWKQHGLDHLWMHYDKLTGYLDLDSIRVKRGERNRGKGAAAMRDVTAFADKYGLGMTLETAVFDADTGRPTRKRLQKFYKQFGFVLRKGKNYDASLSGDMVRPPKKMQPADRVIDTEGLTGKPLDKLDETHFNAVERIAKETAMSLNYDPDKIKATAEMPAEIKIGQYKYRPSAICDAKGNVTVYAFNVTQEYLPGLIAHETMHAKYFRYLEDVKKETTAMFDRGRAVTEGKSRHPDPFMDPQGMLKAPYDREFPLYQHHSRLTEDTNALIKDDGCTPYSKEWWTAWKAGKVLTENAMHETLAEMARVELQTGKVPNTGRWQNLYQAVNDHWDDIYMLESK